MQKFENVKLRSVRNIFAVNQNPSGAETQGEDTLFAQLKMRLKLELWEVEEEKCTARKGAKEGEH